MPGKVIPRAQLDIAALAVHRVLTEHKLDHAFFGGYQLEIMGCIRGTKDVDVVVKKPFFNGFKKVKNAFGKDSEFKVFDGNRTDAIRAIHFPSSVGVDIMLQDLPKSIQLAEDCNHLPFFTTSDLFITKIGCLIMRKKDTDISDILFLFDECHSALDFPKIKKKVTKTRRDEALARQKSGSRVAEILESLYVG